MVAGIAEVRQDGVAVVVALDGDEGRVDAGAVLAAELGCLAGELQRSDALLKLRALRPGAEIDDLNGGEVAVRAAARGVHGDEVLGIRHGREPDAQRAGEPGERGLACLTQTAMQALGVEAALAGGEEAELGIFGELLGAQRAVAGLEGAAVADLRGREAVLLHELQLVITEFCNRSGYI